MTTDSSFFCSTNGKLDEVSKDHLITATKSSVGGRFQSFSIKPINGFDFETSVEHSLPIIEYILQEMLTIFRAIKFYIIYEVRMSKIIEDDPTIFGFYTKTTTVFTDNCLKDVLGDCKIHVLNALDGFHRKGSYLSFHIYHNQYLY